MATAIARPSAPNVNPALPRLAQPTAPNVASVDNHDSDCDSIPDSPAQPTLNDASSLAKGIVHLTKHKKEITILLVGETGVGKTTALSLIANVLGGRSPEQYKDVHDTTNEAGGSAMHSQTNAARLYVIQSRNGITIRILDTPGLADTRGLAQDAQHKKSIAETISRYITTVNAVIILANGTVPRLGVATDYALTTLSSIFPRTLANNIGIMFTNVSSPLSWNFDEKSLPDVVQNADRFLIDNPVAMQKKYKDIKDKGASPKIVKQLRRGVQDAEQKAFEVLVELFDWLDGLSPQPTKDILTLYEQSEGIDKRVTQTLADMNQAAQKKQELQRIIADVNKADVDMNTWKNFQRVVTQKVHKQSPTSSHNTLCSYPNCYSNCHIGCQLDFTLDPSGLAGCWAMDRWGNTCEQCGHSRDVHRHFNTVWKLEDDHQTVTNYSAKANFESAQSRKAERQRFMTTVQIAIDGSIRSSLFRATFRDRSKSRSGCSS